MKKFVWACCVVAALSTTACMADPPPPQTPTPEEVLESKALYLGLKDPQATGENDQVSGEEGSCTVYLLLQSGGTVIVTAVNTKTEVPQRFDTFPTREEYDEALTRLGC